MTWPSEEGTCKVNANCTVPVVVEGGGEGVVAHVGLHALEQLVDRVVLAESGQCRVRVRRHRRVVGVIVEGEIGHPVCSSSRVLSPGTGRARDRTRLAATSMP